MSSSFHMIDVGEKPITRRVAEASGFINLSPQVCRAIVERRVPKGDVLALAEVAGIMGAKRTADLLPLCHPLAIETAQMSIRVSDTPPGVAVVARVIAHGKTGVEMEALTAVQAALLCIYDLTKSMDRGAVLSDIQLTHKSGGKSGAWNRSPSEGSLEVAKQLSEVTGAVLTISDRCASGSSSDGSGKLLVDYLERNGAILVEHRVIPDDAELIRRVVREWAWDREISLILLTGGTGISPRDVTPEALAPLWSKQLPGFGAIFRAEGMRQTPRAWLSRADAGVIHRSFVVSLPGSVSAVQDGITMFEPIARHALDMMAGRGH